MSDEWPETARDGDPGDVDSMRHGDSREGGEPPGGFADG